MSHTPTVRVDLLGKDYHIACGEDERQDLLTAARYLDAKMRLISEQSRLIGAERIAIMAALNIAHELVQAQRHNAGQAVPVHLTLKVKDMQGKLEDALGQSPQAELALFAD